MFAAQYPKALREMLFDQIKQFGMDTALEKVHASFPEFAQRLTRRKAQKTYCNMRRALRTSDPTQKRSRLSHAETISMGSGKTKWSKVSQEDRKQIVKMIRRLRKKDIRWSNVVEHLTSKFPNISIPRPNNLSKYFGNRRGKGVVAPGQEFSALLEVPRKGRRPYKKRAHLKQLTLSINNSGSVHFEATITPEIALRIIGEVVS